MNEKPKIVAMAIPAKCTFFVIGSPQGAKKIVSMNRIAFLLKNEISNHDEI
jgi:hypothetical protein